MYASVHIVFSFCVLCCLLNVCACCVCLRLLCEWVLCMRCTRTVCSVKCVRALAVHCTMYMCCVSALDIHVYCVV